MNRLFKIFTSITTAAFAAMIIQGCAGTPQKIEDINSVCVGVVLPLSGEFEVFGKEILQGIELYMEKANSAGGVNGKKIVLCAMDNKSRPENSVEAYFDLVKKKKTPIVIGAYSTTNTFAIKGEVAHLRVPLITPGATNDLITERNAYVFRSCFSDSFQGKSLGRFAYKKKGLRKIAVMLDLDENGDYSKGLARAFIAEFEKAGGKIVAEIGYHCDKTDYVPLLKKAAKADAEAIFLPGYPKQVELMVAQAPGAGFAGRLFGGDGWDVPEALTKADANIKGCYFSAMFYPDLKCPLIKAFVDAFKKKTGRMPSSCAAQGYDTAGLVAKALEAGSTPEAIRKALLKIRGFKGVTGKITMTKDGNAVKDVYIKEVYKAKDGRLKEKLLDVIYP